MKKKIIIPTLLLAFMILIGSAFALFSGDAKSNFVAELGTVEFELKDLNLTNSDKIAPGNGDNNYSYNIIGQKQDSITHEFSFIGENLGTKSVRTHYTILLTAENDGDDLDASYMRLTDHNGIELENKSFLDKDGNNVFGNSGDVSAVKYEFDGEIFDGRGKDILDGGEAEKEKAGIEENDNGDVEQKYSYQFVLSRDAKNDYQNSDISIDVICEAMQYRNTKGSDFEKIRVKKTYTTKDIDANLVPSKDEDKDGKGF